MNIKNVLFCLIGYVIVLFALWGFFFSFHLFPWVEDTMEWWYIPHLFTALFFAVCVCLAGVFIVVRHR